MKAELNIETVLEEIFEKQDCCTIHELYDAVEKYNKKHLNTYVFCYDDDLQYYININKDIYWWDNKYEVIRKQEVINCPCCDRKMYRYPNVTLFEIVKKYKYGMETN